MSQQTLSQPASRTKPSQPARPGAGREPVMAYAAAPKASLDWRTLQKALVFTKLAYHKPVVEKKAKPGRPPVDAAAPIAVAVAAPPPARVVVDAGPPTRLVDVFGETDERLLPWSWD